VPSQSVEAATRDEAIAAAREKFGPTAKVVGVRRIRSGGMFGFFTNERFIAEVEVAKPAPVGGPDSGSLLKVGPREQAPAASMDDRMRELADLLSAAQEAPSAGLYGRSGSAPAAEPTASVRPVTRAAAGALARDASSRPVTPVSLRAGASSLGRLAAEPAPARRTAAPRAAAAAKPFTPVKHTLMLPADELDATPAESPAPAAERAARPSPFAAALTRMVASNPVQAAADAAVEAAAVEAAAAEQAAEDAAATQAAAVEAAAAEAARAAAARIDAAAAEAARQRAEAAAAEVARRKAEAAAAEAARLQAAAAAAEAVRVAAEAAAAEAARLEAERLEAARVEAARLEAERIEAERVEAERVEAARVEAARVEAARVEAERIEAERIEAERIEAERMEAARLEAEHLEAERVEAERLEAARIEAARVEAVRLEAARLEAARVEAERLEAARVEAARLEAARVEAARLEAARLEAARVEAARVEAARVEAERVEAERVEAERVEAERVEAERVEAARLEAERVQAERVQAAARVRAELAALAQDVTPLSMVESVRTADEELAALLEEVLAANGSGRGRHRLPEDLVTSVATSVATSVVTSVATSPTVVGDAAVAAAAVVVEAADERVLDVPQPWAYETRPSEPSAYDTGAYRTDAPIGQVWASEDRIAQRAAQLAAAQNLVVDAVVVDETAAEDVRYVEARPVEVPAAVPVEEERFAVPVGVAPTLARTASDPAPLPMDATMILPPLSLMPPQRFGGLPPLLPGRPAVPPARRGRPPVPAARPAVSGRPQAPTRPVPVSISSRRTPALPVAAEETGTRLATVTRLVPATQSTALTPLGMDGGEELVVRLLTLGLPHVLLGHDFTADAAHRGVYAALTRSLGERLPVAPRLPTAAGEVLMVVGPGAETLAAARSLALSLRLAPEDVQWAASGALAGLAPENSRIASLETAVERQAASVRRGTVTVVAVDAPLRTAGGPWLEDMLSVWSPSAVWAVLDATRKPEDLVPWLDALPRLDAVVVQDTDATADPAAVLNHVSVPVALVDGARATAHRWASLLCERLEEMDA
jgi:hypothetical protein